MKVSSSSMFGLALLARVTQACVEVRCSLSNDPIVGDLLMVEVWDNGVNPSGPVISDSSLQHFASANTKWEYWGKGIFSGYYIALTDNCKEYEYRTPNYGTNFRGGAEFEFIKDCYCVSSKESGACGRWLACSEWTACGKDGHPSCAGNTDCTRL